MKHPRFGPFFGTSLAAQSLSTQNVVVQSPKKVRGLRGMDGIMESVTFRGFDFIQGSCYSFGLPFRQMKHVAIYIYAPLDPNSPLFCHRPDMSTSFAGTRQDVSGNVVQSLSTQRRRTQKTTPRVQAYGDFNVDAGNHLKSGHKSPPKRYPPKGPQWKFLAASWTCQGSKRF